MCRRSARSSGQWVGQRTGSKGCLAGGIGPKTGPTSHAIEWLAL